MIRSATIAGLLLLALVLLPVGPASASCGEECDSDYASAIDDCKSQYGDDPADAEELATCIQDARDDYRSCLDNCAAEALPTPVSRRLTTLARAIAALPLRGRLTAYVATLSAEDAAAHIGDNATVCGVVASAHYAPGTRAQPTFLNLDKSYPNQIFTAVVFGNDRSKFGEPERLQGKHICVTGPIQLYRGAPEIIIHDPSQLEQR